MSLQLIFHKMSQPGLPGVETSSWEQEFSVPPLRPSYGSINSLWWDQYLLCKVLRGAALNHWPSWL
uniref:Uncharacterized protein n=1 Tax=Apteryx owenii TaxID=8824 RepID=A0A8B9QFR4_APTOW